MRDICIGVEPKHTESSKTLMTPAFKESDTVTVSVLLVSGKLHPLFTIALY